MCAGRRPPNKPRLVGFAVLGGAFLSAAVALALYVVRYWEFQNFGSAITLCYVITLLAGAAAASLLGPCLVLLDLAREAWRSRFRK